MMPFSPQSTPAFMRRGRACALSLSLSSSSPWRYVFFCFVFYDLLLAPLHENIFFGELEEEEGNSLLTVREKFSTGVSWDFSGKLSLHHLSVRDLLITKSAQLEHKVNRALYLRVIEHSIFHKSHSNLLNDLLYERNSTS